ncbi:MULTISPECIES: ammonium transporter [Azospirillum]|uniref:Ammonium transporter n=1 Tax=Azospirillum humicireducens TaxID=1226968 RepID=A0A161ITA8_9PROT|nr:MULTISPECIES: ammonium transporter [Azospirillum]ANC90507.1 ammonium transporter [Azospirillum humicireducens]HYF88103.1 ammonium transporter [Azospirillum sp.]
MNRLFLLAAPMMAVALGAVGMPAAALAQDAAAAAAAAAPAAPALNGGDTAWMLVSTALVLMMTIPGLALFYGGMVRKMNVLATVMQSFAITCLISVLWYVIGYSLAFTGTGAYIGGLDRLFLNGLDFSKAFVLGEATGAGVPTTIPEPVFMMFQMTFAIITPALITGAFADRMKFSSLLVFTTLWSIVVYAPIAHWVWYPSGFLFGMGVLDFAGGTVVHINAGVAGLVAALVIGKRKGYPKEAFMPHNLVLSLIGASLLWVGWFGFNAGSALTAGPRAGMAMAATHIATAGAAMGWLFAEWIVKGKPSILGIISGAVAGLVAVTPAAGFVDPTGAIIIGIVAGVICFWSATSLKHMLGYDDSLDAFGVHGVGGLIGAILTGVFAKMSVSNAEGAFAAVLQADPSATLGLLEGNAGAVWIQIQGVLYTMVWCAVATFVLLKVIDVVMGLRVDEDVERDGLDLALHGESIH